MQLTIRTGYKNILPVLALYGVFILQGCASASEPETKKEDNTATLPVLKITTDSATTYKEYTAAIEGKVNIEIRSQVDGYLTGILVDEGAYVNTGQSLFRIDDKVYREQLNTTLANLHVAEANMNTAQIEVDKLTPLVQNNVISDIQLKTAQSSYNASKAMVAQAKAAVSAARINIDFTVIKAPVSGYIGRIPKRIGGMVSRNEMQGITTLSNIDQVYAYFTLSESGFLELSQQVKGQTLQQTIKNFRPVRLVLANGIVYEHAGKIDLINGQFDKATGSITLRATFPNPQRMIRSGITGKVRMEEFMDSVVTVPIAATMDQQDKIFVYLLGDSNIVKRQSITIQGKTDTRYIVREGVKSGDRIVTAGIENLAEGTKIIPSGK